MSIEMRNVVIAAESLADLIRKARIVCAAVKEDSVTVLEYDPAGSVNDISGYPVDAAGFLEACLITRLADGYTYKRRAIAEPIPLDHKQCAGLVGKILLLTGDRHMLCTGVSGSLRNPKLVTTKYEYTPAWLAHNRCKWRDQGPYNPGVTPEHPCWREAALAELVELA